MDQGEPLDGGNSLSAVRRVGPTVRKSASASSASVHAFMAHLRSQGVDVPRARLSAEGDEQVLEFVPGTLAMDLGNLPPEQLARVGRLVRHLHDAAAGFTPPPDETWTTAIPTPGAELMCHNDLAPWNLLVGERLVFIDWDASAPSTRLWDLAYAAQAFCLNDSTRAAAAAAADLAALVAGYEPSDELRAHLTRAMVERVTAMVTLLETSYRAGVEPWATMHEEGHGEHWKGVLGYVARNAPRWHEALTGETSMPSA